MDVLVASNLVRAAKSTSVAGLLVARGQGQQVLDLRHIEAGVMQIEIEALKLDG